MVEVEPSSLIKYTINIAWATMDQNNERCGQILITLSLLLLRFVQWPRFIIVPVKLYILKSNDFLHQNLLNLEFPRRRHFYKNRWKALIVYIFNWIINNPIRLSPLPNTIHTLRKSTPRRGSDASLLVRPVDTNTDYDMQCVLRCPIPKVAVLVSWWDWSLGLSLK